MNSLDAWQFWSRSEEHASGLKWERWWFWGGVWSRWGTTARRPGSHTALTMELDALWKKGYRDAEELYMLRRTLSRLRLVLVSVFLGLVCIALMAPAWLVHN